MPRKVKKYLFSMESRSMRGLIAFWFYSSRTTFLKFTAFSSIVNRVATISLQDFPIYQSILYKIFLKRTSHLSEHIIAIPFYLLHLNFSIFLMFRVKRICASLFSLHVNFSSSMLWGISFYSFYIFSDLFCCFI